MTPSIKMKVAPFYVTLQMSEKVHGESMMKFIKILLLNDTTSKEFLNLVIGNSSNLLKDLRINDIMLGMTLPLFWHPLYRVRNPKLCNLVR